MRWGPAGSGWVGRAGVPLTREAPDGAWICPETGGRYIESDGLLTEEIA